MWYGAEVFLLKLEEIYNLQFHNRAQKFISHAKIGHGMLGKRARNKRNMHNGLQVMRMSKEKNHNRGHIRKRIKYQKPQK